MPQLDNRGQCLAPNCDCGGFVVDDVRTQPSHPTERCLCSHVWWNHLMLIANPFSLSRGGLPSAHCGGFYPAEAQASFNAQRLCICSRSWLSHQHLSLTTLATSAVHSRESTLLAPAGTPAPYAGDIIARQPPLSAFSNRFSDVVRLRDAVTNRATSIQRSGDTRTSEANRAIGSINIPSGAQRGSVSRRSNRRIQQRSAVRGEPFSTVDPQAPVEFLAILLPFRATQQNSTITYRFSISQIAQLIYYLGQHDLTCTLSLPPAGEVWQQVEDQLLAHLRSQNISVGTAPNRDFSAYFTSPMFLIHPVRGRQTSERVFVETDLVASTFTVGELTKKSKLVDNPTSNTVQRLLFFAPRYRNLWGPISAEHSDHCCFPWRVWKSLQSVAPTRSNRRGTCIAGCPQITETQDNSSRHSPEILVSDSDDLPENPLIGMLGTRVAQGEVDHLTHTANIGGSQDNDRPVARGNSSAAQTNSMSPVHRSHPGRCLSGLPTTGTSGPDNAAEQPTAVGQHDPIPSPIPMASIRAIESWVDRVYQNVARAPALKVRGPSAELVAETLQSLLEYNYAIHEPEQFTPPIGVECEESPLNAFLQRFHDIKIGDQSAAAFAIGNGPVRAVLRAGVKRITQSHIFGFRGNFYHPSFMLVTSTSREKLFWVAGFWSALHLIVLKLTPDPITPWILYAVVYGQEEFPMDLDYIRALDPASAKILEPWFAFRAEDILPDGMDGALAQLLFSTFRQPRSMVQHKVIGRKLIVSVLLGDPDPWNNPDFLAFRGGFDIELGTKTLFQTLQLKRRPSFCRSLFAATSNRRVQSVAQIASVLVFMLGSTSFSDLHLLLQRSFRYRLIRWLYGKGFPSQLQDIYYSAKVFIKHKNNPLTRAILLLQAMTDTELVPLNEIQLKFTLNMVDDADDDDATVDAPAIHFHTCTKSATVKVNGFIQNALREDSEFDDEKLTAFDAWMFSQLVLTGYNRL